MFNFLSEQYLKLIANYKVLLGNPTECDTVDFLRLAAFTLLVLFAVRLLIHLVIAHRLSRKFPVYKEAAYPQLHRLYQQAIQKVGLRVPPPLREFSGRRPLVFTIGTLKPTIFMSPKVANGLSGKELEAVLVHELTHIKRHDNLLVWFLDLLFALIPLIIVQMFAFSFIFSLQNSVYAIWGSMALLVVFKGVVCKQVLFQRELSCDDRCVEIIKDPLALASSLVNVWQIGSQLPKYRWQGELRFVQTFLSVTQNVEQRARRLINYRRPRLKPFVGRITRVAAVALVLSVTLFLWQFHSTHKGLRLDYCHMGFLFCSERAPLLLHLKPLDFPIMTERFPIQSVANSNWVCASPCDP